LAKDKKDEGGDPNSPLYWAAGYRPQREARLRRPTTSEGASIEGSVRGAVPEGGNDLAGFGAAPEDGLRMLAALETMPSLEPDFAFELAPEEEASVTIIERAPASRDLTSLQTRLEEISAALDAEGEEGEPATGAAEEATVEIFELGDGLSEAEAALLRQQFLKAIVEER
jgi:hypothetical protein